MYNPLCLQCMNPCKQDSTVKIMTCPRYQKRVSDREFNDLIYQLEKTEHSARELHERVNDLIDTVNTGSSYGDDAPGDAENEDGGD